MKEFCGLRKKLNPTKYPVSAQRSKLAAESFMKTINQPQCIRVAKALENILENCNVFINDDELIVGNSASRPMGVEIDYYFGIWTEDDIDCLLEDGWDMYEEDRQAVRQFNKYYEGTTAADRFRDLGEGNKRIWPFMCAGITLPAWKDPDNNIINMGGTASSGWAPAGCLWGVQF